MGFADAIRKAAARLDPRCGGCGGVVDQALDFGITLIGLADVLKGVALRDQVPDEEVQRRRSICESCPNINSAGEKLYRVLEDGRAVCGVPRGHDLFRVSSRDGCGCWLDLKWKLRNQKCPLNPPRW